MPIITDKQFLVILFVYYIVHKILIKFSTDDMVIVRSFRKYTLPKYRNKFMIKKLGIIIYLVSLLILNILAHLFLYGSFIKICYVFITQK
jgi:hypothetical protein